MTVVNTSLGTIRGLKDESVHIFRGIPYAAPPIGELRWKSPQAHSGWTGTREAMAFSPISWQPINQEGGILSFESGPPPKVDEDCLSLNIWTPNPDNAKRPVLFWIHGGGFVGGSGSSEIYDGTALATKGDVVVVTINYRLGALGFLNLAQVTEGRISATGNEGLEDQVAALRWVNENIVNFGGDPSNITIFGESAGGMSVGALLAFPAAKGLFQKAIPQSGACHTSNSLDKATSNAERFLSRLSASPSDISKLLDLDAETITSEAQKLGMEAGMGMIFQPCIDGKSLPVSPIEGVREGSADDVQVLVGATRDEWRLFTGMSAQLQGMDKDGLAKILARTKGPAPIRLIEEYKKMLLSLGHKGTPGQIHAAIESDRAFRIPAVRLAETLNERGNEVFQYLFTVESPAAHGALGACHAIDIGYVFGTYAANQGTKHFFGSGEANDQLAETVMNSWISFARSGNPSSDLSDWKPYEPSSRSTAVFGLPVEVQNDPYGATRALWDEENYDTHIGSF